MNEDKLKKLKIGKRYRVKSLERMIREYGACSNGTPDVIFGFNKEMAKLCGSLVTIRECLDLSMTYFIKEDPWNWTSQMLETSPLAEAILRRKHE